MKKSAFITFNILLLMVAMQIKALHVKRLLVVPPEEEYFYGDQSRNADLCSSLGRQIFRSMQKGIVLFNKSHWGRSRRIALKNSGFVVASEKYNHKIAEFYCQIKSSEREKYLNRIMKYQQSNLAIWFVYNKNCKNGIRRRITGNRRIEGRVLLFNGNSFYSKDVILDYIEKTKSFSKTSRNGIAEIVCEMLKNRFE